MSKQYIEENLSEDDYAIKCFGDDPKLYHSAQQIVAAVKTDCWNEIDVEIALRRLLWAHHLGPFVRRIDP